MRVRRPPATRMCPRPRGPDPQSAVRSVAHKKMRLVAIPSNASIEEALSTLSRYQISSAPIYTAPCG